MINLSHSRKQVLIRIEHLEKGIAYCAQEIRALDTEAWEKKEYASVMAEYQEELTGLKMANADVLN